MDNYINSKVYYRGYFIHTYISSRFHERWIQSPDDLYGDPWLSFDSRKVSVEDCIRIIEERLNSNGVYKQLSLF